MQGDVILKETPPPQGGTLREGGAGGTAPSPRTPLEKANKYVKQGFTSFKMCEFCVLLLM